MKKKAKQMNKKTNVTVIIPVHSTECENFDTLFGDALKSISENDVYPEKVLIVAPPKLKEKLQGLLLKDMVNTEIIENNGNTDFASQINLGVEQAETDYFSFLEFDDTYSDFWFRSVDRYIKEYTDTSVFLPIINDVNGEGKFLGYSNEIAWAYEFTDKHGFVDSNTLKEYPNFNPDGMVMKVIDFKKIGGYKSNIKLAFNLEFFLRVCDQSLEIMVIPKIGYKHTNMREGSLFWGYKNGDNPLTPEESNFWMEAAQKEYYYEDDRVIAYTPTEE